MATAIPDPADTAYFSSIAGAVSGRVRALNTTITAAAHQNGASVYELNGFFSSLKAGLVTVGTRVLSAKYQGGFYSLSGYYPGTTGHALIANEVLSLLNQTYGRSFPLVDVAATAESDPAARFRPGEFGETAEWNLGPVGIASAWHGSLGSADRAPSWQRSPGGAGTRPACIRACAFPRATRRVRNAVPPARTSR